jgi:hypothetical protein
MLSMLGEEDLLDKARNGVGTISITRVLFVILFASSASGKFDESRAPQLAVVQVAASLKVT